jgi:hypothetical protein
MVGRLTPLRVATVLIGSVPASAWSAIVLRSSSVSLLEAGRPI